MNRSTTTRRAAFVAAFALALIGCQAIENEEAQDTEQLLSAAGFHMRQATTPEQVANIEAMTQRKIVIHEQNGEPRYVYADAENCRCVYVGDEENYDEFQGLSVRQEIAEDNADAAMDWGVWGPW
jgi:NAD(P)H-dependent flavin oxidoreductase YrpB (nitropropane dioxygenase family)